MNNTEKMASVLNLAKLVRLQQTNQARINPIYDASLYVFSHNDVNMATGKTFPKNKKQFTHEFSCPTHHCFPKFLFFLRMLLLHPLSLRTIRRLILKFCLGFVILVLFRISGRVLDDSRGLGFRIFDRQEVVIGKSTGKQIFVHARKISPYAQFILFFNKQMPGTISAINHKS